MVMVVGMMVLFRKRREEEGERVRNLVDDEIVRLRRKGEKSNVEGV